MSLLVMSALLSFFSIPHLIISLLRKRENCKIYPLPPCELFPYVNLSSQFLWSWQVPCEAGATRTVLIITVLGIFGVRLPLTYLFLNVWKTGLLGAWWIMTIDLAFRSAATYYAFKKESGNM